MQLVSTYCGGLEQNVPLISYSQDNVKWSNYSTPCFNHFTHFPFFNGWHRPPGTTASQVHTRSARGNVSLFCLALFQCATRPSKDNASVNSPTVPFRPSTIHPHPPPRKTPPISYDVHYYTAFAASMTGSISYCVMSNFEHIFMDKCLSCSSHKTNLQIVVILFSYYFFRIFLWNFLFPRLNKISSCVCRQPQYIQHPPHKHFINQSPHCFISTAITYI